MLRGEVTNLFEDLFRKISGSNNINYDTTISCIGKEATHYGRKNGVSLLTKIVKEFSGDQRVEAYSSPMKHFSQLTPEGRITCLEYFTYNFDDGQHDAATSVRSKIYAGEHMLTELDQRINEYIAMQKAAEKYLKEKRAEIQSMAVTSINMNANRTMSSVASGDTNFNIIFNPEGTNKKPNIKMLGGSLGNFRAIIKKSADFNKIFSPLDAQIEIFEGLSKK